MAVRSATVTDPQKIGDGINAYISYKVGSVVGEVAHVVVRRYSEFVWLRGELRAHYPHVLIPALPEKQQLSRFNEDFVAVRHRALQRWLARVLIAPELPGSPALVAFLTAPGDSLSSMKDGGGSRAEALKSAAKEGQRSVLAFVKSATHTVMAKVAEVRGGGGGPTGPSAGSAGSASSARTADDAAVELLERYTEGQAPLLTAAYNAAAALAIRYREQAQLLLDYGATLRAMGAAEGGAFGSAMAAVGLSTWACSTSAYEQAVQETELIVERLADGVRNCRAMRELFAERARASHALADALGEAERLRTLVSHLSTNPSPAAASQRVVAEAELGAARAAADAARANYDKVAASVASEVGRARSDMRAEYTSLINDFVTVQVRNNQKVASAWERILNEVNGAAIAENGGAGVAALASPPSLPIKSAAFSSPGFSDIA